MSIIRSVPSVTYDASLLSEETWQWCRGRQHSQSPLGPFLLFDVETPSQFTFEYEAIVP